MSRMKRMAEQGGLLETFRADGSTYDPAQDQRRLGKQAQAVWDYISARPNLWLEVSQLSGDLQYPETSISARLRDFRKDRFGNKPIESRRNRRGKGTWEYRLKVNSDDV